MLDVWSRRIVGWAYGQAMTADLVLAALNMALSQRRADGVIHHSDQGAQGEFNRSSQHILTGGCDGRKKGLEWPCENEVARAASRST